MNEDLFASRSIIMNHSHHLQELLKLAIQQLDPDLQPRIKEDTIFRCENMIGRLRSVFCIELPPDEASREVTSRLEDINTLNSIDMSTDLVSFSFLPAPTVSTSSEPRAFTQRLFTLLTWAITPGQAGDPGNRPYIATTLISVWKSQAIRVVPNANHFLQRQLLSWLEEKDFLQPPLHRNAVPPLKALFWRRGQKALGELEAIALLFGDLVQRKLFSFSDYLTRMTSFGQGSMASPAKSNSSMDSGSEPTPSTSHSQDHLELLRYMPLWDKISEQLLNQRRIVLYGIRARKTTEDGKEKEIRAEIRRVVPLFFNGNLHLSTRRQFPLAHLPSGPPAQEPLSRSLLSQTLSASKFAQSRVIHHWLLDLVKDYISRYVNSHHVMNFA